MAHEAYQAGNGPSALELQVKKEILLLIAFPPIHVLAIIVCLVLESLSFYYKLFKVGPEPRPGVSQARRKAALLGCFAAGSRD